MSGGVRVDALGDGSDLPAVLVVVVPGVTVNGRIDPVKRLETNETLIVDFKSTEDSQQTAVTKDQLSMTK